MNKYHILVADQLSEEGIDVLKTLPQVEVESKVGLSPEELGTIIHRYDVILVRSATQLTEALIQKATRLKLIGRAGIGVDNIDTQAASDAGVVVMNTPQGNAVAAAEHALSLLFSLARQIPQANNSLKSGKWEKACFKGVEITGKTLGIIGLGNIGQIVAQRAKGLCMEVVAFDPVVPPKRAEELQIKLGSLEQLLSASDFITLHTPLNNKTRHLLDEQAFSKMKKNAFIINAARGGIIDEGALLAALNDKKIAGAALDVFEQEPPPQEYALVNHPKVIVTPHLGASTSEAQERVAVQIAEQVKAFLENGTITNAVNAPNLTGHQLASVQPLMDMAHMLGNFVAQSEPLQPSKITISLCNPPGILTQTPIWHSALAGFLSVRYGQPISWMLAPHKAMRLGIEVVESYQTGNTVQASSVTIDTGSHRITGTLFPGKGPRISNIDGFEIEALPSAHMLLLQNKDVPGVIGQIGTCLGGENVNVSRMQLGLSLEKQALSLWNLDGPLSLEQLKKIQNLPSVSKATLVDLLI